MTGERQEEEVEQSIADVGIGKKWKFILAEAVANNFACKHFFVGREQIVFYGYKADIVSARRVLFSKDFGTLNAKLNGNNYEAYAEGEIEGKRALNAQYIEE